MGAFTTLSDMQACQAEASQSGSLDRVVFDACMIRKGFQKTGDTSYSRSTGVSPVAAVALIAAAVPVAGAVVGEVTRAAETVGAKPGPMTSSKAVPLSSPGAFVAPSPAGAGTMEMDSNTLLLLGGAAIFLLFAMRR